MDTLPTTTSQAINLPSELTQFVPTRKIAENVANYPELHEILSPERMQKLGIIKKVLLELPLLYTTGQPLQSGVNIRPKSAFEDVEYYPIEKSLGIDQCIFLHWGLPEKSMYQNTFVAVSASILLQPETVVTPTSMRERIPLDEKAFDELSEELKHRYEIEYFNMMVTGMDWLEIIARRVLASHERKLDFFELFTKDTLGEIKYFGQIDNTLILDQITEQGLSRYYKFLYDHGFCFYNMEQTRKSFYATGMILGVDPLPEDCGVNYKEAQEFWNKQLGPVV